MRTNNPFATLDSIDRDGMEDTPEEWAAFEQRVRGEVGSRRTVNCKGKDKDREERRAIATLSMLEDEVDDPPLFDDTPSSPAAPFASRPTPMTAPATSSRLAKPPIPPRFSTAALPSHMLPHHATHTPVRRTDTSTLGPAPSVQTPPMPPPLPPPPSRSDPRGPPTLDTPINVPTPTHTPGSVGSRRRDDPASPVPLSSDSVSELRNRKDLRNLSTHYAAFLKSKSVVLEGPSFAATRGGRGRGRGRPPAAPRTVSMLGLSSPIFKGLRFVIPGEKKQVSKHKGYWDVINKLGGTVVMQPDTAITHVIYNSGNNASAALLARELGVSALSDLPEGTLCVQYEWVAQCKLHNKLLPTDSFLCFPSTTLTRTHTGTTAPTRMMDITHKLREVDKAVRQKRGATPTDSETESSLSQAHPHCGPPSSPSEPPTPAAKRTRTRAVAQLATRHTPVPGPGWATVPAAQQDGLDILINGLRDGSVEDDVSDAGSESSDDGNPDPKANKFKCGQKHDGSKKVNEGPNEWLAKEFDKMFHMYEGDKTKNEFQVRGYQKSTLRRTSYPVTSGAQARKIKGIGESMAMRIDEFLNGTKGRAYYEDNEERRVVAVFKDIYGVGKNFANTLYQRGARSIEDLRTKQYGLSEGQRIGVQLYEDLISRMPRDECRQLFEKIRAAAMAIDSKLWIEPMGSYRRGEASSGDLDILITRDPSIDGLTHAHVLKQLIQALRRDGVITHDLSVPHDWLALESKWMGVGRLDVEYPHRRVDILCIPYKQWGAALLYFTGNAHFNRSMRLYARKQGYSLNQRGLFKGVMRDKKGQKFTEGEVVASRTEQDIFEVLGIRWRSPALRRP